jgi:hypothetical protein
MERLADTIVQLILVTCDYEAAARAILALNTPMAAAVTAMVTYDLAHFNKHVLVAFVHAIKTQAAATVQTPKAKD